MKLTKRKGFNFFRSYFDVYNELENAEDKVAFIDALLDRQFMGVKPTNLKGMAKFAYISQTNSIDSQVKGYNDKAQSLGNPPIGGAVGVKKINLTPTLQVQVKEQEKEQVKEQLNIEDRKTQFKKLLTPFINELGSDLLNDFYYYWTEHGVNDKKMKYEKQKSFSVEHRLRTWKKNETKFNNNNNGQINNSIEQERINSLIRQQYPDI